MTGNPPDNLQFLGEGLAYLPRQDYRGYLITVEGTDGVGRTTHIAALREWLELEGFGVVETGWTRSRLVGRTIERSKELRLLNKLTYSLMYAADFADRLEKEILPALRSGFVVLADRYVFTAFARDTVRGCDPLWVRELFGFAPRPHLTLYLKANIETIIRRTIPRGEIDPFEAGLDMGFADDLYDSFKRYQSLLIEQYDEMALEYDFHLVDANAEFVGIHAHIRSIVAQFFAEHRTPNTPVPNPDHGPISLPPRGQQATTSGTVRGYDQ